MGAQAVVLADFGVSTDLSNSDEESCCTFVGSPYWIAPEVWYQACMAHFVVVWGLRFARLLRVDCWVGGRVARRVGRGCAVCGGESRSAVGSWTLLVLSQC